MVVLYICFMAMLRPGEAAALTVGNIFLPSRLMSDRTAMLVRIRDPKPRWAVARQEHVRVDEVALIEFLELWLAGVPDSRRLFSGPLRA